MGDLAARRSSYAAIVTARALGQKTDPRVTAAFAAIPREDFLGRGPWRVMTPAGYLGRPSRDPSVLYQDVVVAIESESSINNGQPSLHALCLSALDIEAGESALHVGAGTGYYTAILATLVGPSGSVNAYEIREPLAARACQNLAGWPNVAVHARSGAQGALPRADLIYVSAGATSPLNMWLDALCPGGRLLFPLTSAGGYGAMLLVTRRDDESFEAHFLCAAAFIPCNGARDDETAHNLEAPLRGPLAEVQSLHRNSWPDHTCWFAGRGWWLSKRKINAGSPR